MGTSNAPRIQRGRKSWTPTTALYRGSTVIKTIDLISAMELMTYLLHQSIGNQGPERFLKQRCILYQCQSKAENFT